MCFFGKKCVFFQIFYLFTYKKYNFKNRSLKFSTDIIFDKYKKLLKFHEDIFFSIRVMNFFKKFFSVKNQNLTKIGHINSFLNETVKDIKFWFSATIRILYKLKIKKKILEYLYQLLRYVNFSLKKQGFQAILTIFCP